MICYISLNITHQKYRSAKQKEILDRKEPKLSNKQLASAGMHSLDRHRVVSGADTRPITCPSERLCSAVSRCPADGPLSTANTARSE